MKKIYVTFVLLCIQNVCVLAQNEDERFANWTDERYSAFVYSRHREQRRCSSINDHQIVKKEEKFNDCKHRGALKRTKYQEHRHIKRGGRNSY